MKKLFIILSLVFSVNVFAAELNLTEEQIDQVIKKAAICISEDLEFIFTRELILNNNGSSSLTTSNGTELYLILAVGKSLMGEPISGPIGIIVEKDKDDHIILTHIDYNLSIPEGHYGGALSCGQI